MADSISQITERIGAYRYQLLNCRWEFEEKQYEVKVMTAQFEQHVIEANDPKAMGSNEAARSRFMTLALAKMTGHGALLVEERDLEKLFREAQVQLDVACDQREAKRWEIRERLVGALKDRGIDLDGVPF